jgi:diguanylate cyclase (GGDEF)-like protein/PAS domain S-box-containing protein
MPTAWTPDPRARAPAGAAKRPLALVVVAERDERHRSAEALAREGLDTLESASLEPALALLAARPAALIVIDAEVAPEACHAIRRLPGGSEAPILALVEPEDADAARHACEAGASDFAARPVDAALLRERARLLLARAEERHALLATQERLESAQRLTRSGSFSVALASGEVTASAPLFELLGLAPRAGQHYRALTELLAAEDREPCLRALRSCLEGDRAASLDVRVLRGDGAQRVLRCRLVARRDLDGEPRALEGSVQDVTEGRRIEERMRSLAYTDEPTQLGNRRFLEQRLAALLREPGAKVGLLMFELDHFERVNDTLGPRAGDALLREAASRLLDAIELGDGIECGRDEVLVTRRSGGEFALLVPRVTEPRALAELARRCLDAVGRPFRLDAHEVMLGASVGIAVAPDDGDGGEALVQSAATALHHAKAQGRGVLQFYRASMNAGALSRMILEAKLRRALEQGEFVLHYQPQISLQSGEVVGFEGVVRWQEPELGLVGPDEFIPLAEETGLILRLGDWILREACRQAVAWHERGVCPVPISVNLSPQQFREPGLAEQISTALSESGAPVGRIGVEVTENVLLHDRKLAIETLARLRALGLRVALDDFGTGYSSLSYLRHLPADALKIDRSFLVDIASDDAAAALTASIVAMGVALGLHVIAEGVEEEQQRRLLKAWGCHEAQGFLFGRAVPADEAERSWAAHVRDESEEPASGEL